MNTTLAAPAADDDARDAARAARVAARNAAFARGQYGQIRISYVPDSIRVLLGRVNRLNNFDEGITSINNRGGFLANNCEIYGYDLDRNLVAIQYRQAWKAKDSHYLSVSKSYILAGLDEGDQLFSHVLATSYQRNPRLADASPESVIRWAESKIFGVPLDKLGGIIRQGDIALVPRRSIPAGAARVDSNQITLRNSHIVHVDGALYKIDGRYFADGMIQIDHAPGQHRSIDADGRYEIVVGTRGHCDFVSANSID